MSLIFTDRSRYARGLNHCQMARYLGHHFLGTGIRSVGNSIPLATGTYTHLPIELITKYCKDLQSKLSPNEILVKLDQEHVVRESIETALTQYNHDVDNTGWLNVVENEEDIVNLAEEQCTLVGGLVWVWARKCLPWILQNFQIVAIEEEFELVLGCDCGLVGAGKPEIHKERDCNAVILMTRPDIVLAPNEGDTLVYVEIKTAGDAMGKEYALQYEDNLQFAMGAAALEQNLGKPVSHLYVHALHKGKRLSDYDQITKTYSGPRKQNSALCYAYIRPGNPPMYGEDIRTSYWNVDELTGKRWGATESKGYTKTPVWKMEFDDQPPGIPYYEHYVLNKLSDADLENHIKFIGPIDNPKFLVSALLRELEMEERRWAERIEYIQHVMKDNRIAIDHPNPMSFPVILEAMQDVIPRSWNCRLYYQDCEYKPICFQHPGWEDPLNTDKYIRRYPNHPIESTLQEGVFEDRE